MHDTYNTIVFAIIIYNSFSKILKKCWKIEVLIKFCFTVFTTQHFRQILSKILVRKLISKTIGYCFMQKILTFAINFSTICATLIHDFDQFAIFLNFYT